MVCAAKAAALLGAFDVIAAHKENHGQVDFLSKTLEQKQLPSSMGAGIVDDMPPPQWFGASFRDSVANYNPWVARRPIRTLGDMYPTAQFDKVDNSYITGWTDAAPMQPNAVGNSGNQFSYLKPDFVPEYQHPASFPNEKKGGRFRTNAIPIDERNLVASADRIRPISQWENRPEVNYPLVAPADRIKGGPIPMAEEDSVPFKISRYVEQLHDADLGRMMAVEINKLYQVCDADQDGAISPEEYTAELEGHQKKTQEMAQRLWAQFHKSESADMSKDEFIALASTGFDLGQSFVPRKDIKLVLTPEAGTGLGFWGGGTACPDGKYAAGIQLKVMPLDKEKDNTALNAVKVHCDDGTVIASAEGPDGAWSDPGKCPDGQMIYGVRVRNRAFTVGMDNTGINDVMFYCRTKDLGATSEIKFGDPARDAKEGVVVAKATPAKEGGWESEATCGASLFLCGVQVRLLTEQPTDNIGVTDMRFFCCSAPVDCSGVCGGAAPDLAACQACKDAAAPPKAQN